MSLNNQIVGLNKKAEEGKRDFDELLKRKMTSNNQVCELESLMQEEHEAWTAELQKAQDDLLNAKQIANDCISELDSQIASRKNCVCAARFIVCLSCFYMV
jgi:hypothetical protein